MDVAHERRDRDREERAHERNADGELVPNGQKNSKNFPLPDTAWTNWYLHSDGTFSTAAPGAAETGRSYFTGAAQPATRNRAEIPAQYRWDFSAIYPGWDAWEAGLKDLEAKMEAFAALKGSLAQGPAQLLKAYRALDEIGILQYKVFRYPQLQRDTGTRVQDVAGKFQRVTALFARFGTITAWFTPELLRIPQPTVEQWIRETPELAPYRFPIQEDFRKQKHVLDERGEKLLSFAARANETPRSVYTELSTSDIKYPKVAFGDGTEVVVSPANYQRVLRTRYEQADRARAFEAHLGTYAATANTYAAIYNGVLQRGWFLAQARNGAQIHQLQIHDGDVGTAARDSAAQLFLAHDGAPAFPVGLLVAAHAAQDVGLHCIADDHRLIGGQAQLLARGPQHHRAGLADAERFQPAGGLQHGDDGAAAGAQAVLGRAVGIHVGGDQLGPGEDHAHRRLDQL